MGRPKNPKTHYPIPHSVPALIARMLLFSEYHNNNIVVYVLLFVRTK